MARQSGISITLKQEKGLRDFMTATKKKKEYRAAHGLLQRAAGKTVEDIAREHSVSMKQVFTWTSKFRAFGVNGLHVKKQTGRPPKKANSAKARIEQLLKSDPQLFGYLKGRWVLRDISRQLKKEDIDLHFTGVGRVLNEIGIELKSPRLRALGSTKKNYRKRKEIANYKQVAPALFKKRSSSRFKMRNG